MSFQMDTPKISVGIPVYNGERVLRRALESLCAQTCEGLEIVISDNASTDATAEICREYAARDPRVKYFRNERNIGPIANFRRVTELARGEYFAWNAADDVRPGGSLETCVRALDRCREAVMAHGPIEVQLPSPPAVVVVTNEMNLSSPRVEDRIRTFTRRLEHNGMLFGVFRREAVGASSIGAHYGQDYLFCLKTCLQGPVLYVDNPIIRYQQRSNEINSPMYTWVPVSLRDLLFYRGVRRSKCWLTLVLGCYYLLNEPAVSAGAAVRATRAHVRSFIARYGRHLAGELIFLAFTPVHWVTMPLQPLALKAVGALRRYGLMASAADRAPSQS